MGYRNALEILVKDFAIKELHMPYEQVAKTKLIQAIDEYLGERDIIAAADVVRILGNYYSHYEKKYPDHDFKVLKSFMEIFIAQIHTKLLIAHPPVARKS